jgi:phospholipase/carboxylesterase
MRPTNDFQFIHTFESGKDDSQPTLLLLHGTGGDENDLLPIGKELWPGAAMLSPRGKVLENGLPRFFRRFAEGVFDIDDLKFRTEELAGFIDAAEKEYGIDRKHLIAVGYSNGANIAASLILQHPHYLAAAVLFRATMPFAPDLIRDYSHLSVFLGAGIHDPFAIRPQVEQLAGTLQTGGADVALFWHQGGHELGSDDVEAARNWLAEEKIRTRLAA